MQEIDFNNQPLSDILRILAQNLAEVVKRLEALEEKAAPAPVADAAPEAPQGA